MPQWVNENHEDNKVHNKESIANNLSEHYTYNTKEYNIW